MFILTDKKLWNLDNWLDVQVSYIKTIFSAGVLVRAGSALCFPGRGLHPRQSPALSVSPGTTWLPRKKPAPKKLFFIDKTKNLK